MENLNPVIKSRFFLIGCPRSGTTLLQGMLMAHPSVHSFIETHYFDTGFQGKKAVLFRPILKGYYFWIIIQLWRQRNKTSGVLIPNCAPHYNIQEMTRRFINILDQVSIKNGAIYWLEKTPAHLNHIEKISKFVPKSKFIHMLRDGRSVVASLYSVAKSWGKQPSIIRAIERWNASIAISSRYIFHSGHYFVDYENLVRDPEKSLLNLCEKAGLNYSSEMLNYQKYASKIIRPTESWKNNNFNKLLDNGLEKYQTTFDEQTRNFIENRLDFNGYKRLINNING